MSSTIYLIMKNLKTSFFSGILIILYLLTGVISSFKSIDIHAPQWVYLGVLNMVTLIYLYYDQFKFREIFTYYFSSLYFTLYLIYIIWAGFSFLYAINPVETALNLPRYFTVFIAIGFVTFLLYQIPNKFEFIALILSLFLFAEVIVYFNQFIEQVSSGQFIANKINAFSGNKNIAAASMVVKLPFAYYYFKVSKKPFQKVFFFCLLTAAYTALTINYARTALINSTLFVLIFTIYSEDSGIKEKAQIKYYP